MFLIHKKEKILTHTICMYLHLVVVSHELLRRYFPQPFVTQSPYHEHCT